MRERAAHEGLVADAEAATRTLATTGLLDRGATRGSDEAAPSTTRGQRREVGPYVLTAILGSGAMGVVHRARHRETGALAAVKTVLVQSDGALTALRREIGALKRIDHPGVVRILADGMADAEPWYAMELLTGPTLQDHIGERWTPRTTPSGAPASRALADQPAAGTLRSPWTEHPPAGAGDLDRALTIAARIAAALAVVHAAGLVHRDVKPANIFLRDGDSPILTDFGLAARFDGLLGREVLDTGGRSVGTPAYAAPEQIRGELLDARADIYSLGCVLYELLTGRPPFLGGLGEVVEAHTSVVPDKPSELVTGVLPELDELVMGMLEKTPRARVGYAADVIERLRRLGAHAESASAGVYLYRAAIVGREAEIDRVSGAVLGVGGRRGARVLIGGASGVGKTRVALELAKRAVRMGTKVYESTCGGAAAGGGEATSAPLDAFRPILWHVLDRCGRGGEAEVRHVLGPGHAVLASFEPALAELPGAPLEAPPTLTPDAARKRVQAAMIWVLRALAERGPMMIVIDDLQWADELSLAVLQALDADLLQETGVVVLATYRSDEASVALRQLVEAPGTVHLALERLGVEAIVALVSDMLAGGAPPPTLLDFLCTESEGNAFFVVEYLRAAVEAGTLVREADGTWSFAPRDSPALSPERRPSVIPRPLRRALRQRIDLLDAETRSLLDAAAVLSRDVPTDVLARIARGSTAPDARCMQELFRREILEPHGDKLARFTHNKLREHVYAELSTARRRELHTAAATALEEAHAGGDQSQAHDLELARHHVMAGHARRAALYLARAGERALASGAPGEAAAHLARAIALAAEDATPISSHLLAHWERCLGEAKLYVGNVPGVAEWSGRALARLRRPDVPVLAGAPPRAPDGPLLTWAHRVAMLGDGLRRRAGGRGTSTAVAADRTRSVDAALAAERLSEAHFFQQQATDAFWSAVESAHFAQRVGVSPELARAHATMGTALSFVPLPWLVTRYLASALDAATTTADPNALATVNVLAGMYALGQGDFALAERRLREAERVAREHHDARREAEATALLGNVDYWRGEPERALATYRRLEDRARRSADGQGLAWAVAGAVGCWMMVGRDAEALTLFRESPHFREENLGRSEALAQANLACAFLATGDLGGALAIAEATLRAFDDAPPTGFYGIYGWCGAFDAFAEAWATAAAGSAEARRYRARCEACLSHVDAHARVFRIGRPAALRCRGVVLRLRGAERRAIALFERSRVEAASLGTRFEEARACLERGHQGSRARAATMRATASPTRDEAAAESLRRAAELFSKIGAPSWLARTRREMERQGDRP